MEKNFDKLLIVKEKRPLLVKKLFKRFIIEVVITLLPALLGIWSVYSSEGEAIRGQFADLVSASFSGVIFLFFAPNGSEFIKANIVSLIIRILIILSVIMAVHRGNNKLSIFLSCLNFLIAFIFALLGCVIMVVSV